MLCQVLSTQCRCFLLYVDLVHLNRFVNKLQLDVESAPEVICNNCRILELMEERHVNNSAEVTA